jgi:hypothetical protein
MTTSLLTLVDARALAQLHDEQNARWHQSPSRSDNTEARQHALEPLVTALHRANFELWHAEDDARLPQAEDAATAAAKRTIDRVNQQRNDAVEQIDELLLRQLAGVPRLDGAEQHSETPGMMIDRLSILSLKMFHTAEEMERPNAPVGHLERNAARLAILREQRYDLASCLERLWGEVCVGKRFFKRYQQLKMYNDPDLNPALYGRDRR